MRYRLDGSARRTDAGTVVIGGSPLTLVRLSSAGREMLDRVTAGDDVTPSRSVNRLVDLGILHPRPQPRRPPRSGPTGADVTVVIPVRNADVSRLLASLTSIGRVLVIDDGSDPPLRPAPPADVVRLPINRGPAAARNVGLAEVTTTFVAFVDADVTMAPSASDVLDALLPPLDDEQVALVAPRVRSEGNGRSPLARYERDRSPLDLGGEPARVSAGTRVSYLPAAMLVARVDALRSIGGFDEALRTGEDVDLVWRLVERGWRVRYEPAVSVDHAPRADLLSFVAQRIGYGRSAGPLARRHPGALAPVRVSGWSAAVWALVGAGHPAAAVGVALATTAALARKLGALEHRATQAARLAGLGHLFAARQIASAITRSWWPIAVLASVRSRRARRITAVAALAPALWDWVRQRPPLDPVAYTALRVVDDAAYGAGLWLGAFSARTVEPLRPDLTSWPRRSRYDRFSGRGPSGR